MPERAPDFRAGEGAPSQAWLGTTASVLLCLAAAACLAVFGRALTRLDGGPDRAQVVAFYMVPALLAAAMLAALRLGAEARAKLALLVGAGAASLLLSEALLLLTAPQPGGPRVNTLYDIVVERRAKGEVAFPRVPGNVLVDRNVRFQVEGALLHPLAPAPGGVTVVLCNEGNEPVTYHGDRFGFNNPDSLWDTDVELALVGDSYTAGVCVEPNASLGRQLARHWRTLNAGMSGAGPLRELGILREYVGPRKPPIVVWVYYEGNDVYDVRAEQSLPVLTGYLKSDYRQGLPAMQEALDDRYASWLDSLVAVGPSPLTGALAGPSLWQSLLDAPRLERLRALLHVGVTFPDDRPPLGVLPDVLRRARADVESWNGRLLLVYLPAFVRYDTWIGQVPSGYRELLRFAGNEGIPLVDLDSAFRASGDPRDLWTSPAGHLNAQGYRIAAHAIAAAIDSLDVSTQ